MPACLALSQAAGWNQTIDDWSRLLALEPKGCFGIDIDGQLAGTTTALRYGSELAWIGMVLTDARFRHRGVARALVTQALEFLRQHGLCWVKLDASDEGRPLYQQLGFVDERPIQRWGRGPAGATMPSGVVETVRDVPDAFSADRGNLLRSLSNRHASVPGRAFAYARPGANGAQFGPCVADSPASARALVQWFLSEHPNDPVFWDLLPDNEHAVALAAEMGFACRRRLTRMALALTPGAPPLTEELPRQYATAGFEYG